MAAEGKRGKLRMRSSIDKLPPEARQALEEMIADPYNGLSYADMADEIEEMCGERLSTSAIGRHAQRYMRDKKRVDIVLERMRIMAEYSRDHALPDVSRFINALIQDGLMRRILDSNEEFDEMSFEDVLKYSIQAQRAAVYEYRYKDASCVREEIDGAAVAEERMAWLRGLMRDKPELMAEIERSYNDSAKEAEDGLSIRRRDRGDDGGDGGRTDGGSSEAADGSSGSTGGDFGDSGDHRGGAQDGAADSGGAGRTAVHPDTGAGTDGKAPGRVVAKHAGDAAGVSVSLQPGEHR